MAKAVINSHTSNPKIIKNSILNQEFYGPNGIIYAEKKERKLFRRINIGRVDKFGNIEIVWQYDNPVAPVTFPIYRSKKEWVSYLDRLYISYNKSWEYKNE